VNDIEMIEESKLGLVSEFKTPADPSSAIQFTPKKNKEAANFS
jgi:hypothetical protein